MFSLDPVDIQTSKQTIYSCNNSLRERELLYSRQLYSKISLDNSTYLTRFNLHVHNFTHKFHQKLCHKLTQQAFDLNFKENLPWSKGYLNMKKKHSYINVLTEKRWKQCKTEREKNQFSKGD